MGSNFNPHEIEWTREKSARYWDFYGSQRALAETYFSYQVGEDVLDFVSKHVCLQESILDYGCGPGFFLQKLVNQKLVTWGLDFSEASARLARQKLSNNAFFKEIVVVDSLPSKIEGESFETVFLIETIEHLLPDELTATIQEIYRVAKPGGYLVITTPNEEDLEKSKVICPDCGNIFHAIQHVNCWSVASLTSLMAQFGFATIVCTATIFRKKSFLNPFRKIKSWLQKEPRPNLIYIGQKI